MRWKMIVRHLLGNSHLEWDIEGGRLCDGR
jgi:hypothetical protein